MECTIEEAINELNELTMYVEHAFTEEHKCKSFEALQMAIEALEKQIPKKPKIVEADMDGMDMETGEEYTYKIDEAHCINCDSVIGNEYDRFDEHYCNRCGQKIDWSDEDDGED